MSSPYEHLPLPNHNQQATREELCSQLEEITASLAGWYRTRESDSVKIQVVRRDIFIQLSHELRMLVDKLAEMKTPAVYEVGHEQIYGFEFGVGAYSMTYMTDRVIQPTARIELLTSQVRRAHYEDRPEPHAFYGSTEAYFGDHTFEIPLSTIARSLNDGGSITIPR